LVIRKSDVMHIFNAAWTRGTKIPRQERIDDVWVTVWFDPFCPKVVGLPGMKLPLQLAGRSIVMTRNSLTFGASWRGGLRTMLPVSGMRLRARPDGERANRLYVPPKLCEREQAPQQQHRTEPWEFLGIETGGGPKSTRASFRVHPRKFICKIKNGSRKR
jgi:hypothetical protein